MNDSATFPIVLPGFPIALFLEARRHNEALVREFTFIVEAESAPTDSPVKPCSVIGVSTTRRAPNSCSRPWLTL